MFKNQPSLTFKYLLAGVLKQEPYSSFRNEVFYEQLEMYTLLR